MAGIDFSEFVAALRDQIRTAQEDADPDLPIEVGTVTVEFTVTTRREREGKAGVRFWVVDASLGAKVGNESTQKVTMQLTPLRADGTAPARVNDREPTHPTNDETSRQDRG